MAIGELAARYRLPASAAAGLVALVGLLERDEHAPTTVRAPRAAVDVHVADSLVALELEETRQARSVVDVGSGAGFPGLPLALALPEAKVVLLEANGRKAAFLERAVAAAEAGNARVVNARAEEWQDGMGSCDLVVVRALASPSVVAEYAAPLLSVGGVLVAWRGERDREGELAGAEAAAELGLEVAPPHRVEPYRGVEHRYLHMMRKAGETPARFPRRAGIAVKRPLGAQAARPRRV